MALPALEHGEIDSAIERLMVQFDAITYRAYKGPASDHTKHTFMADKVMDVVNQMEKAKADNLSPNEIALSTFKFLIQAQDEAKSISLMRLSGNGQASRIREASKWARAAYQEVETILEKETRLPAVVSQNLRKKNRKV